MHFWPLEPSHKHTPAFSLQRQKRETQPGKTGEKKTASYKRGCKRCRFSKNLELKKSSLQMHSAHLSVRASTVSGRWEKPNGAKRTFGREPRRSPESRFLSAGGSETQHSCHFVFVLWRETEERPAYRAGQRSAVEITELSFSFSKTQTRDRWRLIFHLSGARIFSNCILSETINIAVIPVIILLLLDAPCAEKNVLFLSGRTVNHFSAELMRERWELKSDQQTVQTDIRGIHHRLSHL